MTAHIESVEHCSNMAKALVRKTFLVIHRVHSFRWGVKHLVRPQATQESRKNIADYGSNKTKSKGLEIWACVEHMCISWCIFLYGRVSLHVSVWHVCLHVSVYVFLCGYMTEWHMWSHMTDITLTSYMYVSCFLQQKVYIPPETSSLFLSITLTSRKVLLISIRYIIFQGRKTRTCPTQL